MSRIRMGWPCLRSLSDGKWELTWSWFENSETRRSPNAFFSPQEVTELSWFATGVARLRLFSLLAATIPQFQEMTGAKIRKLPTLFDSP